MKVGRFKTKFGPPGYVLGADGEYAPGVDGKFVSVAGAEYVPGADGEYFPAAGSTPYVGGYMLLNIVCGSVSDGIEFGFAAGFLLLSGASTIWKMKKRLYFIYNRIAIKFSR